MNIGREDPPVAILVVDDEEMVASIVSRALKRVYRGDVQVAASGRDAVEALRNRAFDLVVTDLQMPDVDGLAVVDAARASRPGCAVVVMTGHASAEAEARVLRAGASLLRKPFDVRVLRNRVATALSAKSG